MSAAVPADAFRALVGRPVVVDAPASTANLGAGYDCLGLALDLANRVTVEGAADGEIVVEVDGEGAGELPSTRENRFLRGVEAVLEAVLGPVPRSLGWRVRMENRIPLARGLGSSAAATVGGIVAGAAFARSVGRADLPPRELLRIATGIETHPDNAAAVLLGGFVVSADLGHRVEAFRFDAPEGLQAVLFIPERRLSTEDMRRALPSTVPLADAVSNLGRVAIGVAAIAAGRLEILADLTVDRLHEPYRAAVYPELPRLTGAAREAGALGACLSGAGSSVAAFVAPGGSVDRVEGAFREEAGRLGLAGRTAVVEPRNAGARVVQG